MNYWAARVYEGDIGTDWDEALHRCWRCGTAHNSKLDRAHIVPAELGGLDAPSNLVLLCRRCHTEAPAVADPSAMWVWIKHTAGGFYGEYWARRVAMTAKTDFGFDAELFFNEHPTIDPSLARTKWMEYMEAKVGHHACTYLPVSMASQAWAMISVLQELASQPNLVTSGIWTAA